ncbi:DNA adenine methylase [Paludisphaera rhizosphaerae]|uniref:DNA adenine methylase n=1 Tax=Paludisphaera rhizosphaerae TaxID=2711216 RepID=UPI0019818585|nr:DNA adenine methylase [Paludisphaera rhizosphaerae]
MPLQSSARFNAPLARASLYPELRYMGSKHRLLPWIHEVLRDLPFDTAADPFCGGGCVAYLLRAMGKTVAASDFLNFPAVLARAGLAQSHARIDATTLDRLLAPREDAPRFIAETFANVFYTPNDLAALDRIRANIDRLEDPDQQALALAALMRSCLKKQPRGVFTISGDLSRHDDGRRDLRLSIEDHFREQIAAFNAIPFDDGLRHTARRADAFDVDPSGVDLVYLDPPYVPRSDDNCYMKRYHFLEGLSCYWRGVDLMPETRVKKIAKPFTPFSYRRCAVDAFDRLFERFHRSIIVLSYSSNGFPDLERLEGLLRQHKPSVTVHKRPHRYHFGTHRGVGRAVVEEFLIVGR